MKFALYISIQFIVLFISQVALAQFDINEFIGSARSDLSLESAKAKLEFLKDNNFNGPWLSRVEFRTRSNDANISQEDFRFRLTPSNPAELKAYKRYYQKAVAFQNIEYRDLLNSALKKRYRLVIDHYFASTEIENLQQQLQINHDIIAMINQSPGRYSLDLGDLIDAESDELEMNLAIEDARIEIDEVEYLMKAHHNFEGDVKWQSFQLLDVEDILTILQEIKIDTNAQHVNLVKMEQRHSIAAERINIEKSESYRNIGFIQAEYDTDRGDAAFDHFGYQLGLRIPIVNPDKPDLNRRKLAIMDDAALLEDKRDEYNREKELVALRIDRYASQFKEVEEKIDQMKLKDYLRFQRLDRSIDISDLIKMNEFFMELLEKRNEIAKNLYEDYLEYIDLSGKLAEVPLRNYLVKGTPEIQ
jgi:hypothetical protein